MGFMRKDAARMLADGHTKGDCKETAVHVRPLSKPDET